MFVFSIFISKRTFVNLKILILIEYFLLAKFGPRKKRIRHIVKIYKIFFCNTWKKKKKLKGRVFK